MRIAFYKGRKRLFNRLVAWWTNGPYSHVEAVMFDAADGKCLCGGSSMMDGGVRKKLIKFDPDHWDIIEITAHSVPVIEWFQKHNGEEYDALGLFGFLGKRGTQLQSKWFCSEAVAAALGFKEPWRYDPNTLFDALMAAGGIMLPSKQ